jgi:hypothetical protein
VCIGALILLALLCVSILFWPAIGTLLLFHSSLYNCRFQKDTYTVLKVYSMLTNIHHAVSFFQTITSRNRGGVTQNKVLIIGVDGVRRDALLQASTPNMDKVCTDTPDSLHGHMLTEQRFHTMDNGYLVKRVMLDGVAILSVGGAA